MELFICIKMDLTLNKLQWLICHKTQPNQTRIILVTLHFSSGVLAMNNFPQDVLVVL